MKRVFALFVPVLVILLGMPPLATPQSRWRIDRDRDYRDNRDYNGRYGRYDSKDAAYRAGVNDGYREGTRQGRSDLRSRRRYNDKAPNLDRWIRNNYYGSSRYRNEYKNGFKKGYKEGYRYAYRGSRDRGWFGWF